MIIRKTDATPKSNTGYAFPDHARIGVLLVFECDHRVTLLELFNFMHKGKFGRSGAFIDLSSMRRPDVKVMAFILRHCSKGYIREITLDSCVMGT
jgi:hypothetical protein